MLKSGEISNILAVLTVWPCSRSRCWMFACKRARAFSKFTWWFIGKDDFTGRFKYKGYTLNQYMRSLWLTLKMNHLFRNHSSFKLTYKVAIPLKASISQLLVILLGVLPLKSSHAYPQNWARPHWRLKYHTEMWSFLRDDAPSYEQIKVLWRTHILLLLN